MARPRIPTAVKQLTGEKRPSRLNKGEPKPLLVEPKPPRELSAAAKSEWKRVARILFKVRVLTEADLAILRGYCTMYARALEADAVVKKEGIELVEHRGTADNPYTITKEHPAVGTSKNAWTLAAQFARELGLTPVSRTRIQSREEEQRAELRSFVGGKSSSTSGGSK